MSEKAKVSKTRNYACIVYPDSAPFNWQELLEMEFISAFISPLHDKDKNPTGEEKKPHYHVIIMFDGPKTKEQAKVIFDKIGGVGCEVVQSIRGYARYLCHLDNPEKEKYSTEDVRCLGGSDYQDVISLPTDRRKMLLEIVDFCVSQGCDEFADLVEYCMEHRPEWFPIISETNTLFLTKYLTSVRERDKRRADQS